MGALYTLGRLRVGNSGQSLLRPAGPISMWVQLLDAVKTDWYLSGEQKLTKLGQLEYHMYSILR